MEQERKKELLRLMRDGGRQICDYAISQWIAGKYLECDSMRPSMIRSWQDKRIDVGELYREMVSKL